MTGNSFLYFAGDSQRRARVATGEQTTKTMTRKVGILVVALVVAFVRPPGIGLPSTASPTSSQVERLAGLAKLWGVINADKRFEAFSDEDLNKYIELTRKLQ